MTARIIVLGGMFLLSGCAAEAVKPGPTSDQVLAEQYRARGDQGAIDGMEGTAIADAYHHQIARPPRMEQSNSIDDQLVK